MLWWDPRSAGETLVIQFDQEKFEQLLSEGGSNPASARKHMKIFMARSLLAITRKQVPRGIEKAVCWPKLASIETELTSLQYL